MTLKISLITDDVLVSLLQPLIASGLTAIGTNQVTALSVTASVNIIATSAAGSGVQLPLPGTKPVQVVNRSSNDVLVYPASGCSFESQVVNAPVLIPAGGSATFIPKSASAWVVT